VIDLRRGDGAAFHPDLATVLIAVEDVTSHLAPCRTDVEVITTLHQIVPAAEER